MDGNAKAQILQRYCEFYEYSVGISATNKNTITIISPCTSPQSNTAIAQSYTFETVEEALRWLFPLMQTTNKRCRKLGVTPVWDYKDILLVYQLGHEKIEKERKTNVPIY